MKLYIINVKMIVQNSEGLSNLIDLFRLSEEHILNYQINEEEVKDELETLSSGDSDTNMSELSCI